MAGREHVARRDRALLCGALAGAVLACAAGVAGTDVTRATLVDTEPVLRVSVTGPAPKPPATPPRAPRPAETDPVDTRTERDEQSAGLPSREPESPVTTPPATEEEDQQRTPPREPAAAGASTGTAKQRGSAADSEDCPAAETPDETCTGKEQPDEAGR